MQMAAAPRLSLASWACETCQRRRARALLAACALLQPQWAAPLATRCRRRCWRCCVGRRRLQSCGAASGCARLPSPSTLLPLRLLLLPLPMRLPMRLPTARDPQHLCIDRRHGVSRRPCRRPLPARQLPAARARRGVLQRGRTVTATRTRTRTRAPRPARRRARRSRRRHRRTPCLARLVPSQQQATARLRSGGCRRGGRWRRPAPSTTRTRRPRTRLPTTALPASAVSSMPRAARWRPWTSTRTRTPAP
mmetsp:Transcript_2977/g.10650  ORF Transcript_2977/g.10650 Transcript_2977/m.10650 type:complete len:250 (+) Transcript_2977:2166-2915(+)